MQQAIKKLIINADDFGMGSAKSKAIALCAARGSINSVSFAVNAMEAMSSIEENLKHLYHLPLGLHLNLSEGLCLTKTQNNILGPEGRFRPAKESLFCEKDISIEHINDEIYAQLERFRSIVGKVPSHIDSHQHFAYLSLKTFSCLLGISAATKIPIRSPQAFIDPVRLEQFLYRVKSRLKINLPFSPNHHAQALIDIIATHGLNARTDDCIIDFDFNAPDTLALLQIFAKKSSTEVLCHPIMHKNNIAMQ
jgi:hypothetical protein